MSLRVFDPTKILERPSFKIGQISSVEGIEELAQRVALLLLRGAGDNVFDSFGGDILKLIGKSFASGAAYRDFVSSIIIKLKEAVFSDDAAALSSDNLAKPTDIIIKKVELTSEQKVVVSLGVLNQDNIESVVNFTV